MKTPEHNDLPTEGLEHPNTEEVGKIDFMKAIESIKQHVKNALIEMDEKYNQKFEEMRKYVHDTLRNQEKTIKKEQDTLGNQEKKRSNR